MRILYSNVEWERPQAKQNEPLPTTPNANFHPEGLIMYMMRLKGGPLLWDPSGKPND